MCFDGRTILITGAGRGLGRGAALGFARLGAQVALVARTYEQVAEATTACEALGARAFGAALDVTDFDALQKHVWRVEQRLGPVDVLVNNAGVIEPIASVWQVDPAAWLRNVEINLGGVFVALRAVLPGMVRRGRGRVVNVSTGAGLPQVRIRGWSAYSSAKAGLDQLTRVANEETRSHGVTLVGFNPGLVDTEMQARIRASNEEAFGADQLARFRRFQVEGRLKDPEATGRAILWLASGEAADISGELVDYDDSRLQQGMARLAVS